MKHTKKFDWMEDAVEAVRKHFEDRNMARAISKRVYLRKPVVDVLANGDMTYTYQYQGEAVVITKTAYHCEVSL